MIVKRIRSPTTRLACWMVAKRCRCAHCSLSVRITRSSARARWCWTSFKARPPSPRRAANTTRRLQRSNSGSTMASGAWRMPCGPIPGRARAVRASVQGPSRGVWRGDAELAVQRLMSSSIFMLIVNYLDHDVSRFSLGQYKRAFARLGQKSDAQQRLCDGQGVCGIVNVKPTPAASTVMTRAIDVIVLPVTCNVPPLKANRRPPRPGSRPSRPRACRGSWSYRRNSYWWPSGSSCPISA